MIAQYQGLNVNELDLLRKELREKGIFLKLQKIELQLAIKDTPKKDLEKFFTDRLQLQYLLTLSQLLKS